MRSSPLQEKGVLLFALVFPTVVTFAYFVVLAGNSPALQQTAYGVGKTLQFAFPAVWIFLILHKKWRLLPPKKADLLTGLLFGLAVFAAMFGLFHFYLKPSGFFDGPAHAIRTKIEGLGLGSMMAYAGTGVFYAIFHSFLEEYYWRWFVYGRMRVYISQRAAIVISSLGFMAHHIILLATYFGWTSPATYVFSLAVAIGGIIWAWLYERTHSLYSVWLSHCIIDAAIFIIGYDLVRDLLMGS